MDQSRALNALASSLALAKSATSPRAAADLITQATSNPNTFVFAELLQQPNIRALESHEQYGNFHELLKVFAWGTWESYKATPDLPPLSSAQATKLRLLTLLTLAAHKPTSASTTSHLSYASLCHSLDLDSSLDLEHLITQAIYNDLLTAVLNPASQTVVITSVAPLRDLAPGSVTAMMSELAAWSGRCDSVLADLEMEIEKVKAQARKRGLREAKAEKQVAAVTEASDNSGGGNGGGLGVGGYNTRGTRRKGEDDDDNGDVMEVDNPGGTLGGGGKKRSGGGGGMLGKMGWGAGSGKSGR